jgi:peptidoglycan-associated lipoprotein
MKTKNITLCFLVFSGIVSAGGCTKTEMVKKDEPVALATLASSKVKSEPVKVEQSPNKPLKQSQIEVNATHEVLVPITNASELQVLLDKIYFDFNEYALSAKARSSLVKNSELMKKDQSVTVRIEGHCDERGSDEYNLALGEKRAKAAMQYMVTMGIPEKQLSVISYGKEKPVATGHDEDSWAQNRRDEFVISSK